VCRVVVAGAADDHPADAVERLASVVGPIRVRAQRGRRPLTHIAEEILEVGGELPIGDLVLVDPEYAHVHAMQRRSSGS
jgi:hypothetical protein